jgi:hypothetical protein
VGPHAPLAVHRRRCSPRWPLFRGDGDRLLGGS